jgi:hypothetical protein
MYLYEEGAGRLLSMCPTQVIWQNVITQLFNRLVEESGANGVYIDQTTAMPHELCFNKQHGHPLGGGHYWVDANRDFLKRVRNYAYRNGRHPVLTSESGEEVFLDLMDGGCWGSEPTDSSEPDMELSEIPLFEVVYSGYFIPFGTPVNLACSDRFFRFWQGRGLLDGRQLGFMGLDLFRPENMSKAEYLRLCARYRLATLPYLEYGRLLGPLEPKNSVGAFTEKRFGFDPSGQDDPSYYHQGTVPAAEGRIWQAEDGRLGIFLANYTGAAVDFQYEVDPPKFGLRASHFEVRELSPEGSAPITTVTGIVQRTESLGPGKLKVIEIAPAKGD